MARLLRTQTPQSRLRKPTVVFPPPLAPPVSVNLASDLLRRRGMTRRFPMPGWGSMGWGEVGQLSRLDLSQSYPGGGSNPFGNDSSGESVAQRVFALGGRLQFVDIGIATNGVVADNVVVEIQGESGPQTPNGIVLASVTVPAASFPANPSKALTRVDFSSSGVTLNPAVHYWVVVRRTGAADPSNFYLWLAEANPLGDVLVTQVLISSVWTVSGGVSRVIVAAGSDTDALALIARTLGVRPPRAVTTPPPVVTTIDASLARIRPRPRIAYIDGPVSVTPPAAPAPVVTALSVNFAAGLTVNQRRAQQRRARSKLLGVIVPPRPPVVTTLLTGPTYIALGNQARYQRRRARPKLLGVIVPAPPPVVTKLSVNLASDHLRRHLRRFPLQGFEQVQSFFTVPAPTTQAITTGPKVASSQWGTDTVIAQVGQKFTNVRGVITSAKVWLSKSGTPVDNVTVEIRPDVGGLPSQTVVLAASSAVNGAALTTTAMLTTVTFATAVEITGPIWLVLARDGLYSDANFYSTQAVQKLSTEGPEVLNIDPNGSWSIQSQNSLAMTAEFTPFTPEALLQQRFLGPRPPTSMLPLPTLTQQTVEMVRAFVAQQRSGRVPRFPLQGFEGVPVLGTVVPSGASIVLDSFGRADASDLGSNWTSAPAAWAYTGDLSVINNAAARSIGIGGEYWNQASFSEPFIGRAEMGRKQSGKTFLDLVNVADTTSGYQVEIISNKITLFRNDGGVFTTLAFYRESTGDDFVDEGNVVAVRKVGSSIQIWEYRQLDPYGEWRKLLDFTDTTYSGPFFVGLGQSGGTTRVVRNFGAASSPTARDLALTFRLLGPRPPMMLFTFLLPVRDIVMAEPSVANQRRRIPLTKALIFPPATLAQPPPTIYGPKTYLTRSRPQRTRFVLAAPSVVAAAAQTFAGPKAPLVSTRPRRTHSLLFPPATLQAAAPTRDQLTIRTTLVRARPRHTVARLAPPATLTPYSIELAEATIRVALVRTRPRHTLGTKLAAPTIIDTVLVRTLRIALTRARPRPTSTALAAPTVLATFSGPRTPLVKTRPRPIRSQLFAPTTLQTFVAEPVEDQVAVSLVPERPRYAPHSRLFAPAVIRVPSVELREQTIAVTLTRTRPRPTTRLLEAPTVLSVFAGPFVSLVHTRPLPTTKEIFAPTVLRVPSVEQQEQTIRVALVRTRPRPTTKRLAAPTVLRVPSVEQREQTITVKTVRTRPRPTTKILEAPTVLFRPPVRSELVTLAVLETRVQQKRRFPLQGQRHRLVRETGSTVTCQQRDPLLGPRPPQIIDPLPDQRQQTVKVLTVALRTGLEQKRHFPLPGQRQRIVRETGSTVTCQMRDPLLGVRPPQIVDPLPNQQQQTIAAKLVAVRTRIEQQRHASHFDLFPPTVVERSAFAAGAPALVRTRPSKTHSFLTAPTTLRVFAGPVEDEVFIRTVVERPRHAPHSFLRAPTVLAVFAGPDVALTRIRPRATASALAPPTALTVPSVEQQEETIRVTLAWRTRTEVSRRAAHSRLSPPVFYRATSQIRTALVKTRPRPIHSLLAPPRIYKATSKIATALVRTRPRAVHSHLALPAVAARGPVETKIHVALVQTRPRGSSLILAAPVVVATRAAQPLVIALARTRPQRPNSVLRAPTVVNPRAEPTITTIITILAVQPRIGLLRRGPHSVIPKTVYPTRIGVTFGIDVGGSAGEGGDIAGVSSDGSDFAASATEGEDKEAGT